MILVIKLEVDPDDTYSIDANHGTGLTNDAYERLCVGGSLEWLGSVTDTYIEGGRR